MANKCHVRSISLPSRSHPSSVKFEEELNKLKTLEISSTSASGLICIALSGLDVLYNSVEDVLNIASSQGVVSKYQGEKCLDGMLDGSDKILDICSILVDTTLQIKEQVRAIQSALRRRKDDSSIEASVKSYTCFRKQLKRTAKTLITELRKKENRMEEVKNQDQPVADVIRVLREVDLMTCLIFQAVLFYLSASKTKHSRWSFVSKVLHKGTVVCEEKQENLNEFVLVDASFSEGNGPENLQVARERLEALEMSIEGLERSLGIVFRRLMKTKASLLNIMSQ